MKKKVNLFLVGAAKAGTTTLFNYLKYHPQIFGSPIKEPNFFGSDIQWSNFRSGYKKRTNFNIEKYLKNKHLEPYHNAFINSINNYENLFRDFKGEKYILEASTSYLYSKNAYKEIYKYNPDAKIMIILRDPVERIISHYKMDYNNGTQLEKNILKGIKKDYYHDNKGYGVTHLYVELSLYFSQIQRYASKFSTDQILILNFDSLKGNSTQLEKRISNFLSIQNYPSTELDRVYNKSSFIRFPFLKKIDWLKNIVPTSFKRYMKSKNSILYNVDNTLNVNIKDKNAINEFVAKDWEKTKGLLKNNFNVEI